jgi:hypothetical protein
MDEPDNGFAISYVADLERRAFIERSTSSKQAFGSEAEHKSPINPLYVWQAIFYCLAFKMPITPLGLRVISDFSGKLVDLMHGVDFRSAAVSGNRIAIPESGKSLEGAHTLIAAALGVTDDSFRNAFKALDKDREDEHFALIDLTNKVTADTKVLTSEQKRKLNEKAKKLPNGDDRNIRRRIARGRNLSGLPRQSPK